MHCPSCNHDNRAERRFCTECGATLSVACPSCDASALARTMQAKAFELRATMRLARLLRDTGRCDEARALLAEIYGWFTEGFDTRDLQDAKALLEELGT